MLREEDMAMALVAFEQGRTGYAIDESSCIALTLEDVFGKLRGYRFVVDWGVPETTTGGEETVTSGVIMPATQEPPDPPSMTVAVTAEIPDEPKKKTDKTRRSKDEIEQLILKAWNGGERSIAEIQRITGCTYATVRRYIPISPNG